MERGGVRQNLRERNCSHGETYQEGRSSHHRKVNTAFVANIPMDIDPFGLKGIFSKAGRVLEVTIPKRQGIRVKFGFVRFADMEGVQRSISILNNRVVRGVKLVVQEATGRRNLGVNSAPRNHHRPNEGHTQNLRGLKENLRNTGQKINLNRGLEGGNNLWSKSPAVIIDEAQTRTVRGVVNEQLFQRLMCSPVGETEKLFEADILYKLVEGKVLGLERIIALQRNKFIIQFSSEDLADRASTGSQVIHSTFTSIRKWSCYDSCELRSVWLEVSGVPPLGWKSCNFANIVSRWGNFVKLEKEIESVKSFESMKVLILSDYMSTIHENLHFSLQEKAFSISVKEAVGFFEGEMEGAEIDSQIVGDSQQPLHGYENLVNNPNQDCHPKGFLSPSVLSKSKSQKSNNLSSKEDRLKEVLVSSPKHPSNPGAIDTVDELDHGVECNSNPEANGRDPMRMNTQVDEMKANNVKNPTLEDITLDQGNLQSVGDKSSQAISEDSCSSWETIHLSHNQSQMEKKSSFCPIKKVDNFDELHTSLNEEAQVSKEGHQQFSLSPLNSSNRGSNPKSGSNSMECSSAPNEVVEGSKAVDPLLSSSAPTNQEQIVNSEAETKKKVPSPQNFHLSDESSGPPPGFESLKIQSSAKKKEKEKEKKKVVGGRKKCMLPQGRATNRFLESGARSRRSSSSSGNTTESLINEAKKQLIYQFCWDWYLKIKVLLLRI